MEKKADIAMNLEWCKSCEICVKFCPQKVYEMGKFYPKIIAPEACTGCKICENLCPDFVITITPLKEKKKLETA